MQEKNPNFENQMVIFGHLSSLQYSQMVENSPSSRRPRDR